MIKASDLRVGNYLKGDELNIPKLGLYHNGYTKITGFGISMIEQGNITSLAPIPLTPEILDKCGFVTRGKDDRWYHLKLGFTDYEIMITFTQYGIDTYLVQFGSAGIKPNCEYLHQLQNLFFCLCGEELTIKL